MDLSFMTSRDKGKYMAIYPSSHVLKLKWMNVTADVDTDERTVTLREDTNGGGAVLREGKQERPHWTIPVHVVGGIITDGRNRVNVGSPKLRGPAIVYQIPTDWKFGTGLRR